MKSAYIGLILTIAYVRCHPAGRGMANDLDIPDDTRPCQNGTAAPRRPRVWTMTMPRHFPPMNSLDEETMEVMGMSVDMMRAACEVANQQCVFLFHEGQGRCWNDTTQSSLALDNGWADACPTYNPTGMRKLMYAFSHPYTKEEGLALYVRREETLRLEDLRRENNVKIGFISDFWINPECLGRHGVQVNEGLATFDHEYDELFERLRVGEVRMIFSKMLDHDPSQFKRLDLEGMRLTCTDGGFSVMTRKDNVELLEWLNPAIEAVIKSAQYKRMCYIWPQIFNEEINCL